MKNMIQRVSMMMVVVMMLAALATGAMADPMWVTNCNSYVTLRAYASTQAPEVARISLYEDVDAYYYNGEFMEVYYNGMHGYVLATYLTNGSAPSAASQSGAYLGKMTVSNCNEFVTLRASASTSAATVTKVALGQVVDAYYYNGIFARCFYNGLEGYILMDYLR